MDSTATSLCMDNNMPMIVFDLTTPGNISRAFEGRKRRNNGRIKSWAKRRSTCVERIRRCGGARGFVERNRHGQRYYAERRRAHEKGDRRSERQLRIGAHGPRERDGPRSHQGGLLRRPHAGQPACGHQDARRASAGHRAVGQGLPARHRARHPRERPGRDAQQRRLGSSACRSPRSPRSAAATWSSSARPTRRRRASPSATSAATPTPPSSAPARRTASPRMMSAAARTRSKSSPTSSSPRSTSTSRRRKPR